MGIVEGVHCGKYEGWVIKIPELKYLKATKIILGLLYF